MPKSKSKSKTPKNTWTAKFAAGSTFVYRGEIVEHADRDFYTTVKVPEGTDGHSQQRHAKNNIRMQIAKAMGLEFQFIEFYQSDLKWVRRN